LRAQLLMAFYTIRSERQLMEQINYKLLFRWSACLGDSWANPLRNGNVPCRNAPGFCPCMLMQGETLQFSTRCWVM